MVGRKRKDSRGETLVELLASILIAALSVALLFTCCMTAAAMGRDTREADGRYYEALSAAEEKAGGLEKSLMGVVGLETAFPVLYTRLVRPGILTVERLSRLLSDTPRRRFSIPEEPGYTVFEVETPYQIDPETFATKGRSTPFAGDTVSGRWVLTHWPGRPITRAGDTAHETT